MKMAKVFTAFFLGLIMMIYAVSCQDSARRSPGSGTTVGTASISGYAEQDYNYGGTYSAFSGAGVFLYENGTVSEVKSTSTNAQGYYSLTELDAGTYDLVLKVFNYQDSAQVSINSSAWTNIDDLYVSSYTYLTKTALTLADSESMSVDFRFSGY